MPPPLTVHDLSDLKKENQEFQKAVTKAVTNLKDLSQYSEYIHRPLNEVGKAPPIVRDAEKATFHYNERNLKSIQIAAIQDMQEEYERLINELTSQIRLLQSEVNTKDARAAKEALTIAQLTTNIKSTTAEIDAKTKVLTDCMERIQELETTVAENTRILLSKETELKQAKDELGKLRVESHDISKAKNLLLQEKQLSDRKCEREKSSRKKYEKKIQHLEEQLRISTSKCEALEQNQAYFTTVDGEHRKDLQVVVEQLEETKGMLGRVQLEMTQRIGRREARITRLQRTLSELHQGIKLKCKRAKLLLRVEELSKLVEDASLREISLKERLRDAVHTAEKAVETTSLEQERSGFLKRELDRIRHELHACEESRRIQAQRHAQELMGKDEEAAYVWQKFVQSQAKKPE